MRSSPSLVFGFVLALTGACSGDPPLAPAPVLSLGGNWEGVTAGTTPEGVVHEATIVLALGRETLFRSDDSAVISGTCLWRGDTVSHSGHGGVVPMEGDGYGSADIVYDGRHVGDRSEVPATAWIRVWFGPSNDGPDYPGAWPTRGFQGEGVWDLENETLTVTGQLRLWEYCETEGGWGIYGDPHLVCGDPVGYTSTIVFRRRSQ